MEWSIAVSGSFHDYIIVVVVVDDRYLVPSRLCLMFISARLTISSTITWWRAQNRSTDNGGIEETPHPGVACHHASMTQRNSFAGMPFFLYPVLPSSL